MFGLEILQSEIQDFSDNITRFLVVSRAAYLDPLVDKTTVVFSLPNEPGALFKALSVFALRDIDLTKIESRPIRGRPWDNCSMLICRSGATICGARARWSIWPSSRALDAHARVVQELEESRSGHGLAGLIRHELCSGLSQKQRGHHRGPASRRRSRDAESHRLRRRRARQTDYRHRQHVDRD